MSEVIEFKTTDFKTAYTLMYFGHRLTRIERFGDKGRKIFIFEDDGKIDDLLFQLFNKDLRVEPFAFSSARDSLKNLLMTYDNNV